MTQFDVREDISLLKVLEFLSSIGITCTDTTFTTEMHEQAFFYGIATVNGNILVDFDRALSGEALIGDLLHEAGHIATIPSRFRPYLNQRDIDDINWLLEDLPEDIIPTDDELNALLYCGDDLAAQGWSYAAAVHLGIRPSIVFNDMAIDAEEMYESIKLTHGHSMGCQIGVPLYYLDMCESKATYPTLLRWTND
jgi:hypothetical protein